MITHIIHDRDAKTGEGIPLPPAVEEGIRIAKSYLDSELDRLSAIPIFAEWLIRKAPTGKLDIQFSLTSEGVGIAEVPYSIETFSDPKMLKSCLRRDIWYFTTYIAVELKQDIKKLKSELVASGVED